MTTEADGRRLNEVGDPRLFATAYASPQPFLPPLDEVDWQPARRLAPYRLRAPRRAEGTEARLPMPGPEVATG